MRNSFAKLAYVIDLGEDQFIKEGSNTDLYVGCNTNPPDFHSCRCTHRVILESQAIGLDSLARLVSFRS